MSFVNLPVLREPLTASDRIYISGPMTGLPELNKEAFDQMRNYLRARGYQVLCPSEMHHGVDLTYEQCMKEDIAMVLCCSAIVLLPGWERSRGAITEIMVAKSIGLRIYNNLLQQFEPQIGVTNTALFI